MKTHRLHITLRHVGALILALICASATARADNPPPLKLRDVSAPMTLIENYKGAAIVRSVVANLGANRGSCWGMWVVPRGKTKVVFEVWQPKSAATFARLGTWNTDMEAKFVSRAQMTWLNFKTATGWTMSWYDDSGVNILMAFPKGARTRDKAVVREDFGSGATSISESHYELGAGDDPRGFYPVTYSYSEPGQDAEGNTITLETRNLLLWNGAGWSARPPKR